MNTAAHEVLDFWFGAPGSVQYGKSRAEWFRKCDGFDALIREDLLEWARKHYVIIERFGRFPHRNAVLGRVSTSAEIEFLEQPRSGF